MSEPKIGVTIATPVRRWPVFKDAREQASYLAKTMPQIGRALWELRDHPGYEFEFLAAVGGICRARNQVVHDVRKEGKSRYILWWDDDVHPENPAEAVLRLLSHRKPLVFGLYCRRAKRPMWTTTWMPAAPRQDPPYQDLLQVAEQGTGFGLVYVPVYDKIEEQFVTRVPAGKSHLEYAERETGERMIGFYQQRAYDNDMPTEDFFFNYLCRCCQIPILVDTALKCLHRGDQGEMYPDKFPPIPGLED